MADDATLRIILRLLTDPADAGKTKAGIDDVTKGLKNAEAAAAATKAQLQQLKSAGRELSQVGVQIGAVGLAIGGPLVAAAKAFVDANQKTSLVARAWLSDTQDIESSYQRIGGVVAQQLLPAMDQAAKLVDKLATFAEQNPGLVKMALGASGALVAGGAGVVVLGQATQTAANIGLLVMALNKIPAIAGVGGVAGVLGSAAVVGSAGAAAGIAAGAAAGYGLTALLGVQAAQGGSDLARGFQAATEALRMFVNRVTGMNFQIEGRNALGGVNGTYGPPAPSVQMYSGGAQRTADQTLADKAAGAAGDRRAAGQVLFGQYQQSIVNANADYSSQYNQSQNDFVQSSTRADMANSQARARQVRDFGEQQRQIEAASNAARIKQLRDFTENEALQQKHADEQLAAETAAHDLDDRRAAQDHLDALAQLASDHGSRSRDLAAAGDALGFAKEQQAYKKQVDESNANAAKDKSRRDEDFTKRTQEEKAAAEESRQERLAAFQQQQSDQDKQDADSRAQRERAFAQQLRDEDSDYAQTKRQRESDHQDYLTQLAKHNTDVKTAITAAFNAQLTAIDPILTGMTKLVQQKYQDASAEFQKYIDGLASQTTGGAGYCQPGWHWDAAKKACVINKTSAGGGGFYASGGYAGYGAAMLGEQGTEFVLNNATTSAAERLSGGPLTQEKILASLGRGGNSYSVNLGGVSGHWSDRASALEGVIGLVDAKITEAFSQFEQEIGN